MTEQEELEKPDEPDVLTRARKYSPELIERLLAYVADGLNLKQACKACLIHPNTLREWRDADPRLEERVEEAREKLRAKLLKQVQDAATDDWRAAAEALRLMFIAEYKFGTQVNVNAQQAAVAIEVSDPERAALIEKLQASRARALSASVDAKPLPRGERSPEGQLALPAPEVLPEPCDPFATPTDSLQAEAMARRARERSQE